LLQQKLHADHIQGVTFYGRLPLEEGLNVIARCHVGLAVLKPIPNYIESYPTKMFEYMALGLPVIVSDFPLYRQIIDKYRCGLCVDPNNPAQLADALRFMIKNPDQAVAMGQRGQMAVFGEMNWAAEGRKLVDFYHSILSSSV
jgi:glycosyltransferase involved in cell wall biosynthesis